MRTAVLLSAGLFLAGLLLLPIADALGRVLPAAHGALLLVLAAVAALGLAVSIALWPGNETQLKECLR